MTTTTGSEHGVRRIALPVNEIFGPVPQGEGPYAGRASTFIRFGHCNLRCPPCDTASTWDRSRYDLAAENPETLTADIVRRAREHGAEDTDVVLTGGEPLLWQRTVAWNALLYALPGPVHVETNGTVAPSSDTAGRVTHFSVSPKIGAMGAADPLKRRIRPDVLAAYNALAAAGKATYKFVAGTADEVDTVAALVAEHRIPPDRVYVMPLGDTHDAWVTAGRDIVDRVMHHGYHLSGRLHLALGVR